MDAFKDEALRWIDGLYAAALRLTRNPADAEDLVQDTYVKALAERKRFTPGTNLRAWLFTLLRHRFLNDRRHAAASPIAVDADSAEATDLAPDTDGLTPEASLLKAADRAEVQAALARVPEPFREAVWLRDAEGFSYVEIGRILNVPVGTVMSRISRGRRALARALGGRLGAGERKPA